MFDQMAIGGEAAMALFAAGYARTLPQEIARNPRRALYPERELWRHVRSSHLRTVTLRGFRSALVRSGGRREDSFVKLRQDHPDLARVAMPPVLGREECAG